MKKKVKHSEREKRRTSIAKKERLPKIPKLYSVTEFAEIKGVTRTTVFLAARDGKIPGAFCIGRNWIIPAFSIPLWEPRSYGDRR